MLFRSVHCCISRRVKILLSLVSMRACVCLRVCVFCVHVSLWSPSVHPDLMKATFHRRGVGHPGTSPLNRIMGLLLVPSPWSRGYYISRLGLRGYPSIGTHWSNLDQHLLRHHCSVRVCVGVCLCQNELFG